jgi:DNA polymerase-3 subunit beta
MKFTTSIKTLRDAFYKLMNAVQPKTALPILSCVFMTLKDNLLTMLTTDLTNYIAVSESVKSTVNGTICVSAKVINDIINSLSPDAEITFELIKKTLFLTSNDSKFELETEDANDFPTYANIEKVEKISLSKDHIKAIGQVIHAASTDELHRSMNGVYFDNDSKLSIVATDGHRLSLYKTAKLDKKFQFLLNLSTARLLNKYGKEHNEVDIEFNTQFIKAVIGNMAIVSRLIDDTYPDYASVIPTEFVNTASFDKKELTTAVKLASMIAGEQFNRVILNIGKENCVLSSMDEEKGLKFKTTISCENKESYDAEFNGAYFLDMLNATENEKDKPILFEFTPTMLHVNQGSYMEIVMQLRNVNEKPTTKTEAKTKIEEAHKTRTAEATKTAETKPEPPKTEPVKATDTPKPEETKLTKKVKKEKPVSSTEKPIKSTKNKKVA